MRTDVVKLEAIKAYLQQTSNNKGKPIDQIRRDMDVAASKLPKLSNVKTEGVVIGKLRGEWVRAKEPVPLESRNKAILYFHGGGFVSGTCVFYRDLAARISLACGVRVLTLEYRLAPEHLYPAANEDCLSAYYWLLANGFSAADIVIGGDSVGASLALMTLISLRDVGVKLPAGVFLLSPHTDLVHLDGESYMSRAELDPMGSLQMNLRILEDYVGNGSGDQPVLLSPLRMDLKGLPGMYIQVGDHEVLLSDAVRLAEIARDTGIDVTLEVWENMWSVFQFMAGLLPEAQQAIMNIGDYVRNALKLPKIAQYH